MAQTSPIRRERATPWGSATLAATWEERLARGAHRWPGRLSSCWRWCRRRPPWRAAAATSTTCASSPGSAIPASRSRSRSVRATATSTSAPTSSAGATPTLPRRSSSTRDAAGWSASSRSRASRSKKTTGSRASPSTAAAASSRSTAPPTRGSLIIDPSTGRQRTYSRFRDVPRCSLAGRTSDCSATVSDMAAEPDYAAFGPGGALYVTDIEQALIWRVPRGGGRPSVWLTDSRLESPFGPNGIQFMDDKRTLMLAVTATGPDPEGEPGAGALFTVLLRRDGRPGELTAFWRSRPVDGPDGFALGRSGKVYLALAGSSQIVVISSGGEELVRVARGPGRELRPRRSPSTRLAASPSSAAGRWSPTTRRSAAIRAAGPCSTSSPANGGCRSFTRASARGVEPWAGLAFPDCWPWCRLPSR